MSMRRDHIRNQMTRVFRFLPWVLLFGGGILSAGSAVAQVQLDVDHATFAYDEETGLVEFYFSFSASSIAFTQPQPGRFEANVPILMRASKVSVGAVVAAPENVVWTDTTQLRFVLADTAGILDGQRFVHQTRALLPPGSYEVAIFLEEETEGIPRFQRRVDVPDYMARSLVGISDVTLATNIEPSEDRSSMFYRNGLSVQPNANQLFGGRVRQLFYYAEAYHTQQVDPSQYTLIAYLSDAGSAAALPGLLRRSERVSRDIDVLVGSFDIGDLRSGSYFLTLAILNADQEVAVEQRRRFFVYNPQPVALTAEGAGDLDEGPFGRMSEEAIDEELTYVQLLASDQERRGLRLAREGDLAEKRAFLVAFWQRRDAEPQLPGNAERDAFFRGVRYANDRYSTMRVDGWETDRGRVIIRYGVPSQIEPRLFNRDLAPHEIWEYNNIPGEGQAIFVFADLDGFGEFRLIHSSVTGEIKSMNWQSEIVR